MTIPTIAWSNGAVKLIDQTILPGKFKVITCRDVKTLWQAIKTLQVRGAPAIGVAAGFGVLLGINPFKGEDRKRFVAEFEKISTYVGSSRPTAMNLFNVLTEMKDVIAKNPKSSPSQLKVLLKKRALEIYELDRRVCRQMGMNGQKFIKNDGTYLTCLLYTSPSPRD